MMEATDVKLSIVIPIYNVAGLLPITIESILCQKFTAFEILLVDDGSWDDSFRVCQELASRDARIKVFRQENRGVSAARNYGLRQAVGEYLYFMDADDLVHPQFSEIMMGAMVANAADMVCCEYRTFFRTPRYEHYSEYPVQDLRVKGREPFDELTAASCATSMCNKIIRRELFDRFDIRFREGMTFGEDMFVSWKCCLVAEKICLIPLPLYYYRQSGESAVSRYHADLYEVYKSSFEEIRDFVRTNCLQPIDFDKNYAIYFAQRLHAFLRMEVRAPYSVFRKIDRMRMILDDPDMQAGLLLEPGNAPIYRYARRNRIFSMLWIGYRNRYKEYVKSRIKRFLNKNLKNRFAV
ncbi:MAG: glycosyltransferase [Alistipes sp.]|nr:glycosyltransferase [Alistipes sp.]